MLLQGWSSPGALLNPSKSYDHSLLFSRRKHKSPSSAFVCLSVGTDAIAEIAHNKVIVAAVVSAAIGQISKPFTSVLLYGDKFEVNLDTAFRAGGFPSAHSSAVVATAVSLGLERGFSDAIFGLAVVYAGITMYDAQGVRREVGIHAKRLNKLLPNTLNNSFPYTDADDLIECTSAKPSSSSLENLDPLLSDESKSFSSETTHSSLLLKTNNKKIQNTQRPISSSSSADVKERSRDSIGSFTPLKESVGHTGIEVLAGAILGFLVSMIVHTI